MRNSKKRNTIVGVTAAASLMLLAACGGGSTSDGQGDDDTLTFAEVPDEEANLTVWSFLPGNHDLGLEAYEKIFADFNEEYPQVNVDLVDMPYPSYFDQVRNATVAREGPDVITMYGGAQAYSYRDGLYPLQDAISDELSEDLRYLEESYSKDGNLYIMPTGAYGYVMVADEEKFDEASVNLDDAFGSWDGLLTACGDFADAGIQPIASGWQDGFLLETVLYMISSQIMDADKLVEWTAGEVPITDDIFTTSIDRLVEMNDAGCFGDDSALGRPLYQEGFDQYPAGETAMMITGNLDTIESSASDVPSTTVRALPQVPESSFEALVDAGAEAGWSVTKWTKHPEAATALVNYLASPHAQSIIWEMANVPPNLASVPIDADTKVKQEFIELLDNEDNHTGFASFPLEVLAVAERNAAPLISGQMDKDEFFSQLDRAYSKTK